MRLFRNGGACLGRPGFADHSTRHTIFVVGDMRPPLVTILPVSDTAYWVAFLLGAAIYPATASWTVQKRGQRALWLLAVFAVLAFLLFGVANFLQQISR